MNAFVQKDKPEWEGRGRRGEGLDGGEVMKTTMLHGWVNDLGRTKSRKQNTSETKQNKKGEEEEKKGNMYDVKGLSFCMM